MFGEISGGQLTISHLDGTSAVYDLTPGQAVWINAESHAAENIGTTDIKLLVVELKEPAPVVPADPVVMELQEPAPAVPVEKK